MQIWLDPNKLYHFGLTTLDVVNAIQGQNVQVVAGQLGAPSVPSEQAFQFTVNALGRLEDVSQFENIIVKSARAETPEIVRIRDVAHVELSQQNYANFSATRGHRSANIPIFSLPGANALDIADRVREAVAAMSRQFPPGLKYEIRYDTTQFVRQTIRDVYETLFEAAMLVLIVIMVFLQNWRAMLVPATTVPVTIIGAFATMALLGFGINLMALFALILAIGIVVDDAIIIVENASHYYGLSITLVFLVLAALCESRTTPAAVILAVPMALVIRGLDNDLYIQIGLVLMIALASKNAILVVEFARQLRTEGMSIVDAAVEATRRRFRPIIMTSFAFILGVAPLLIATGAGAASRQSIGTVVFGGMLASTLLAIPFVPVFYVLTQRLSEWYATRRSE
ncbi:efflux RND transporter permease subunit [Methylocaldum sp. RMAD-M]|uniref:efflux RND transporter permease subunit n=1 Tax=Methylocaldum sp. RMAD-M TaxID=2806557 RepID=UPI001AE2AC38|nr:efflux RND transporter permease subunit [Methylocaldum sp. RMAD-M]MBP1151845.1 multidrug efflux pump subunit AcrB [Methylocaldum sp. RMAD-M]